ncbi:lysophospholipase-like protein 1 isoform X2 [Amphiura filiformis]|uniref:lysophospholipase-like protein 1 isoform X2 n=1 Tax=Amphiura filiformis TaxID=82378 RepID=UPI003B217726
MHVLFSISVVFYVENMSAAKRIATIVVEPQKRHTATLFFFHGSGDTANGIKDWLHSVLGKEFSFPHIKLVFTSAPPRPYTANAGRLSTVWYDRKRIVPNVPEDRESVDLMCQQIGEFVEEETTGGIPKSRIVLGGISMGGGLALHLGYRFHQDVAGVFALSSFLNKDSSVYQSIQDANTAGSVSSLPPLFACHGKADPLVIYDWGKKYVDNFTAAGISTEFHSFPNLAHEMMEDELNLLQDWVMKRLPDK